MTGPELVRRFEAEGIVFRVVGGEVKATVPPKAVALVPELKAARETLKAALLARQQPTPAPAKAAPAKAAHGWTPCPVHGDQHCACWFSGGCGLTCSCQLCDGWRKGLAWAQAHRPEVIQ